MKDYTIAENYTLPSKGKVYKNDINPNVRLRSMTTEDEMKRLGRSDRPNELLAEIIDTCLVDDIGISAYDLCIADYQYLMHKLRVTTYGQDYGIITVCPACYNKTTSTINLDSLKLIDFTSDMQEHLKFTLPVSGKEIELRLQTPRMLDDASLKRSEYAKRTSNKSESAILFNIVSMISKVDGVVIEDFKLEEFVKKLPMKDTNCILNHVKHIDFGLDTIIECKCSKCAAKYTTQLPITGEFFGPTN